ncbi:MAG: hypothetical protein M3O70_05060, partial [Actinomycetota bacterium]|nr:hypothetical protein [Actinomycetota bacterium]
GGFHAAADSYWGDLMATSGELSWPSVGSFVSAYEENLMAADTPPPTLEPGGVLQPNGLPADQLRTSYPDESLD